MVGLLLGRPERVSRTMARPISFDCPEALSRWATEQADLVPTLTDDVAMLLRCAMMIRVMAGNPGDLPIARFGDELWSFNDIANCSELPGEVVLIEDHWGVFGSGMAALPENGIAVGSGRMKPGFDFVHAEDPRLRANHPRWTQYWMSLWGATIEAIALAWGVPLQEVLECSEIHENGREEMGTDAEGRKSFRLKSDCIRNPHSLDTRDASVTS